MARMFGGVFSGLRNGSSLAEESNKPQSGTKFEPVDLTPSDTNEDGSLELEAISFFLSPSCVAEEDVMTKKKQKQITPSVDQGKAWSSIFLILITRRRFIYLFF